MGWNGAADGSAPSGMYENWSSTEPSGGDAVDYAQSTPSGVWIDSGGSRVFVIEWEAGLLSADNSADTIDGGAGNDHIYGYGGDDILNGGDGHDLIIGGGGNDTIVGGDGNDTINGGVGIDTINGEAGDDIILPGAESETLRAGAGADTVYGGDGDDIIHGHGLSQQEIETILAANPGVVYNAASNSFYQYVTTNVTFSAAKSNAAAITLNGVSGHLVNITTPEEDAFIFSLTQTNTSTNYAWIGASDSGSEGTWIWENGPEENIQFWSGNQNGTPVAGWYNNWANTNPQGGTSENAGIIVVSQSVHESLWADQPENTTNYYVIEWDAGLMKPDNADDTLYGDAGNDHIYGYGGNDILNGGDGNDLILGGAGNDTIDGGAGNDSLYGGAGSDTVSYASATSGVTVELANFSYTINGFTENNIYVSANGAMTVNSADIDGDGDADVLSASFNDDEISWFENDGTGNFTTHFITTSANGARSVNSTDIDGDGDLDVLSASSLDNKIAWYENDGSGNFVTRVITTSAAGAISVSSADIDGDGDIDVLSASIDDDTIAWYENDGSGNFVTRVITTSADGARSVSNADIDGDGDEDVLSASFNDDKISWYENDGSGNFIPHIITTSADSAISVSSADIDGDGDIDVLSASVLDDKIAWYENDGSGNFIPHIITTSADSARSVSSTDLDGDGDIDVLSASAADNKIAWYENDGTGNFTAHVITTQAASAQSVSSADIDGDGDIDVLSASTNDDTIAWYESNTTAASTMPGSSSGGAGIDTIINVENIIGSAFGDTLKGNEGANIISGGDGNDTIVGRDGNDTIDGGAGNDILYGDYVINPSAMAGNVLWLDASDRSTILDAQGDDANSGGAFSGFVSTWQDKSGNNNNVTGSTATLADIGGKTSVRFTNDVMVGPDLFGGSTGEIHVFLITQENSRSSNFFLNFNGNDQSGGGRLSLHSPWSDGTWFWDPDLSERVSISGNPAPVGSVTQSTLLSSLSSSVSTLSLNDNLFSASDPGAVISTTTGGLRIGQDATNHELGELIVFDRRLSASEEDIIEKYLMDKWKGTSLLTGGADTFVLDDTSVDDIMDFSTAEGDALNIADILEGYVDGVSTITDFVQITDSGANSIVSVDTNGTFGGASFTQVATLYSVTGLTDEVALEAAGNLIMS